MGKNKKPKVANMTPQNHPANTSSIRSEIRHCNPLRMPEYPPMTSTKSQTSFHSRVEPYSARHIANAIGCSLPTAYDWRSGRRAPPAWMQDQILADLASYHPQIRHAEKTA
jgi:hypothetical protein